MTSPRDGWDTVPKSESDILGILAKFREGEIFARDSGDVLNGLKYVVTGVLAAWLKWAGGEIVDRRVTQPGQHHPKRDELPDQDEKLWEPGLDGDPADPWKNTRYLYLVDQKTAETVTFVTDSIGGRSAVSALRDQITNMRAAHPRAMPIVQLGSEKMKTRRFGVRSKPSFRVTGWINGADEAPATIQNHTKRLGRRDEFDDPPFPDSK
jgi:hypothetical protein